MIIDEYRVPSPPREIKHRVNIIVLDKHQKCLGGTIVEDAIWRLIGNSLCLDTEVDITVIDTGIPYFCGVKDDDNGVPIFFKVNGSTTKLSPGDTITFSRHALALEFGPSLNVVTPD